MSKYNERLALSELNYGLAQLFGFARARDEVDFAFSLGAEFRGSQDAGWNTAEEATAAFQEGMEILKGRNQDRAATRNLLYRYLCVAEASGLYETIGNQLSILESGVYNLTPFSNIVERHKPTGKIRAPNANRIFRELAERAERVGLRRLAVALAEVFDDDLRNAVAHADFVIWQDGLRLRKRNGGSPYVIGWKDLSYIIRRGFCFVDLLLQFTRNSLLQYSDGYQVVGRGSANKIPFLYLLKYEETTGAFSISTNSPGAVITPEFERIETIKSVLGRRVMTIISFEGNGESARLENYCETVGIEPSVVLYPSQSEYLAFVDKMVTQSASVFVERPDPRNSRALCFTPIGGLEAKVDSLPLIMPLIPEFVIESPSDNSLSARVRELRTLLEGFLHKNIGRARIRKQPNTQR
jgi:hypothetical protein